MEFELDRQPKLPFLNDVNHSNDDQGQTIVDQEIPRPALERVPYPYEGDLPDAYFDSFKMTLFALPSSGVYTITLTFTDLIRPTDATQPIVVALAAIVI